MYNPNFLKLLDKYNKDIAKPSKAKSRTSKYNNDNSCCVDNIPDLVKKYDVFKDYAVLRDWILSNTSITRDDLRGVYAKNAAEANNVLYIDQQR